MMIKASTALRNEYNNISKFCKESMEPVFLTKNGEGDLDCRAQVTPSLNKIHLGKNVIGRHRKAGVETYLPDDGPTDERDEPHRKHRRHSLRDSRYRREIPVRGPEMVHWCNIMDVSSACRTA